MRLLWSGLIAVMLAAPATASVTLYDWSGVVTTFSYGGSWNNLKTGDKVTGTFGIDDSGQPTNEFAGSRYYAMSPFSIRVQGVDFSNAATWEWRVSPGNGQGFGNSNLKSAGDDAALDFDLDGGTATNGVSETLNLDDSDRFSRKTWGMQIWRGLYQGFHEFNGVIETIAKRPPPNSQQTSSQIEDNDLHT